MTLTTPTNLVEWFPMRVTYQRELKMKNCLDELGVENFVPMHHGLVVCGKTRKEALVPAIHNLIFVRTTQAHLTFLKMTQKELAPLRYIMKVTGNGSGQEILRVPDRQMENFLRVAHVEDDSVQFLKYEKYLSQPGQRVLVTEGQFAGVEGVIKRIKSNKHVVVQIDGVAAVAITYVPQKSLRPLEDEENKQLPNN